jgi:hypothetical protein
MKSGSLFMALLVAVGLAITSQAQTDTDPNKEYPVTPEAGHWLICAVPYVGPQAPQLAHEMVMEIRSRFKLPAYVLNRTEEERRKQEEELKYIKQQYDEVNRLRQQNHEPEVAIPRRLMPRIQEQCAVLVGGYKDQETAALALKEFKKLPPPSNERLCPLLTQVSLPEKSQEKPNPELHYAYANPFLNAFVVRNPTLPREPKNTDKNDPFLKKLNAREPYSLLKCKKPYTLVIAVFGGFHTFQPARPSDEGFFEKLWGGNTGQMLDASGQNAHNLAEVLRSPRLNFEAYVLHTREGSMVTVGSFDREDDPQIKGLQQALATRLKYEQSVRFLPQPMLVLVPHPQ